MSIYGLYFTTTLFGHMGAAKRRSVFNSEAVVDTTILNGVVDQMVDWAATIGARRPRSGLQMIAWMFHDRDWSSPDRPHIATFISDMKTKWATESIKAPHAVVAPADLSKHFGSKVSIKQIKDPRMRPILEQYVLYGLLWGLANPEKYRAWAEQHERDQSTEIPKMQAAGLHVERVTAQQLLEESEAMLHGYEAEVDPLPVIPHALLEDARLLGIALEA